MSGVKTRSQLPTISRGRTALVATTAALGVIPVATGMLGTLGGPEKAPGGGPATPSVDSEYRFASLFWLAGGVVLWWSLRKPEEARVSPASSCCWPGSAEFHG